MPATLEKIGEIAAEKLKEIKAPGEKAATEKAAAEAKVAADAKAKADADTQEKDKGNSNDAKAKDDVRILSTEESELNDVDKKRKSEILEAKKNNPEDKIKRIQESSQKRIDEIVSELKEERNKRVQNEELIKKLESELNGVKKVIQPKVDEDAKEKSKRTEAERINKYVEEDKNKPHSERREMSKEDLEKWYLEDPLSATEWIQERTNRRADEKKNLEKENNGKVAADEFIKKQNESKAKLFAKFPGTAPMDRIAELKKEGKKQTEIQSILMEENNEYKVCMEVIGDNPKFLEETNGPELVMAEMEKRLKNIGIPNKSGKIELTQEELDAKIQAEIDRRANLEGEGASSTKGKKLDTTIKTKSELRQKQEAIAKKAGISMESLDKTIERRRGIPGASKFEDDNA